MRYIYSSAWIQCAGEFLETVPFFATLFMCRSFRAQFIFLFAPPGFYPGLVYSVPSGLKSFLNIHYLAPHSRIRSFADRNCGRRGHGGHPASRCSAEASCGHDIARPLSISHSSHSSHYRNSQRPAMVTTACQHENLSEKTRSWRIVVRMFTIEQFPILHGRPIPTDSSEKQGQLIFRSSFLGPFSLTSL